VAPWTVEFSPRSEEELAFLAARGVDLRGGIEAVLRLGPQPHAYRRIRKHGDGMRLALKEWRVDFAVDEGGRCARVVRVVSGYRPRELAERADLEVHRAFAAAFED
jgi:hypothetical protein